LRDIGANDFPSLTDEACEQYGDVSYATSHIQNPHPLPDPGRNQEASRYRIDQARLSC
jgi:hypothetical protein